MDYKLTTKEIDFENKDFQEFMNQHETEISNIFPHYTEEDAMVGEILLLFIDDEPGGVFIYQIKGEELHVDVDYLIKKYRDQGIGKYFFNNQLYGSKKSGITKIIALTNNQIHIDYLLDAGFKQSQMFNERYELDISDQ